MATDQSGAADNTGDDQWTQVRAMVSLTYFLKQSCVADCCSGTGWLVTSEDTVMLPSEHF